MQMLFICLVVPSLILGPFFPDLIVSISSLIFMIYVFRHKLFFYFNIKPLIIFFIFCAYCILVSIFVAENMLLSFESSLFYFRIGIFCCLIWYLIEKDKKILNYFYYALVISFSALIIDGYIQFFFDYNIIGLPKSDDRISSFFGSELIMGSYFSRLFPLFFSLFILKRKTKFEFFLMSILFISHSGIIYISGERAAFALYFMSLIFITIFVKQFLKFRIIFLISSLVIIVIFTLKFDSVKNRMIVNPIGTISASIFTPQHESLIRTAYNMFLDKPIFGHGPKMFRVLCKNEKYRTGITPCMTHPHNFYIQLLAETGMVGFSFLLSSFLYLLYCVYRHVKSIFLKQKRYLTDYQVCLLSGILITLWPLTTNGNFFNNWLIIIYSLPVGFLLHSIYGKNKDEIYLI
jgi:O-antigen ligase